MATKASATATSLTPVWDKVNKLNSAEVDKYFQSPDTKAEQKILREQEKQERKNNH
jgi:hypothetical protein